jgi:hypothetical protein
MYICMYICMYIYVYICAYSDTYRGKYVYIMMNLCTNIVLDGYVHVL